MNNRPDDNAMAPPPRFRRARSVLVALLFVGLAVIALDIILMAKFSVSILGREAQGFHISGQVVDENGKPVPNAHVVICVSEAVVLPYPKDLAYGVVADGQGRFDVLHDVGFAIDRRMSVAASGPGDLYGGQGISDPSKVNRTWEAADIVVPVLANTGFVDKARYRYDTFSPRQRIIFLGGGWKPVYHENME
jgi:hypothetical protein